nr:phage integrase N-terminal domain-containing protein [Aestuariicella hydrocarbonica]
MNYQLKQLCQRNREGSYSTQANRAFALNQIANQLHSMGYRGMTTQSLKPKHVDALVAHWVGERMAAGTIKNRMSCLRWWAAKVNRQNVVARSNAFYGIPDRQFVSNDSKAVSVNEESLAKISDDRIRMSLELQQVFGLRREEAIKFIPAYADQGDRVRLKASWTKGGKAREIPVLTPEQRSVLNRAHRLAGSGSLIPAQNTYIQQLRLYERHTACAELTVAPVDRLLPQLEESTVLHQALSSHDSGLLFSGVWTPDPAYLNSLLWQQLTPSDWQLWWHMIGAYRAIKRLAYDTGLSGWAADEFSCDVVE